MRSDRTRHSSSKWNSLVSTRISPSTLKGDIIIPPSKSQTMRALVFALLTPHLSIIHNPLSSPDIAAMVEAMRLLGARVDCYPNGMEVRGGMKPAEDVIHCGNSGLVLRLIGALAALVPTYTVLTGDSSIRHRRPALPLIEGINQLGGFATSTKDDGHAPIVVRGVLKGGVASIAGEDSQPVSGLLIAASVVQGSTEIFVQNPGEKPWVNLTLNWLDWFKIPYENNNFEHYRLKGGAQIPGFEYTVPGDWSSALYPIAAALMTGSEITLHGIDFADAQGDKEVVTLLKEMGAHITMQGRTLTVHRGGELKGTRIDIGKFIDAITLLPVLACKASGKTEIFNGAIARCKESDRIHAIVTQLQKMGAKIVETKDGMIVEPSELHGAQVTCFEDHRMGLALSVAACAAQGSTEIVGTHVVGKSFPNYFESMRQLGVQIE